MNYLNFHKKRVGILGLNENYRNSYLNNSKEYINVNFSQSPLYQVVDVEGNLIETRIIKDKKYSSSTPYEQKIMLLRPDVVLNNGCYVALKNEVTKKKEIWLIMFYESDIVTPKVYIRYCNKVLKYEKNSYPVVITSSVSISSNMEENKELVLPKNYLMAYVKATDETMQTREGQRFVIDNNSYEVQTIDTISNVENNIGIVQMNLKRVPKNQKEKIETEKNNENKDVANTSKEQEYKEVNSDGWKKW